MAATLYHEVEKKPFAFSHCWVILNGKPKWNQVVANLKYGKKRNDGSSSNQSIGLDNEEDDVVVENGKATVPKDNRQVMGNKWEKARAARDAVATKMSSTWTGIFVGNVACNFKKIPMITQDLSRRCIATRGGECVHVPS